MPSATSTPPVRIPAWQRLGLKLKSASGAAPIADSPAPTPLNSPKRKRTGDVESGLPPNKIIKSKSTGSSIEAPFTPQLLRKKSVQFTPDTKVDDGDSIKQLFNVWTADQKAQDPSFDFKSSNQAFATPEAPKVLETVDIELSEKERRVKRIQKPAVEGATPSTDIPNKKKKKPKTKKTLASPKIVKPTKTTTRPFLAYLKQYHDDKPNWKFNKNHQNHLLKNIFDFKVIPSDQIPLLYHYIRSLQGGVRTRLRDSAIAVKVKDIEDGAAGFGDKMDEELELKAQRQLDYERCCNEYVATMTSLNASSKMGYEEGLLAGLSDYAMQARVAKRTRAEQILAELAASPGGEFVSGNQDDKIKDDDEESQKRLRVNDGTSRKVARNRKVRTAVEDDTSSSSDSSDSESESDSEASPTPGIVAQNVNDDTSSSSSSSSSESESSESDSEGSAGDADKSEEDSDSD